MHQTPSITSLSPSDGPARAGRLSALVCVALVCAALVVTPSAARATPERLFAPMGAELPLLEDALNLLKTLKASAHLERWYAFLPPLSVGAESRGRLLFSHRMRSAFGLRVMVPEDSNTVPEVALALYALNTFVRRAYPGGADLMVLDIAQEGGGKFNPHKTHQNGADVDVRYYIKGVPPDDHEKRWVHPSKLDLPRMWALLKALKRYDLARAVLMDLSLQKVLYEYGLKELQMDAKQLAAYLSYPAKARGGALVKHVPNHYHHMHIRFRLGFSAQWWDLAPKEAEELFVRYQQSRTGFFEYVVQPGETLGAIASFHRVSLAALLRWNKMTSESLIRPGQVLKVWR
jgi:hypothetical protein